MRIAYNALFLTRPFSGTGQYTAQFLRAIVKALPDAEHIAYVPRPVDLELPEVLKVEVVPQSRSMLSPFIGYDYWERCDIGQAAQKRDVDVFHALYPTPPVKTNAPVVMTVHDMITWKLPQYRKKLRSRVKLGRILDGIKEADHLCAVSQTTKDEAVQIATIPPERITVTYEGLGQVFDKRTSPAQVRAAKQKQGLLRPYIFYIGGYDYRKNVRSLIRAFAQSGLAKTHDLVLAGAVTARKTRLYEDFQKLPEIIESAGVTKQTKTLGFLSEEEKKALLCGADAFIWPSLAEGFGLPVLEALAMGVPTAASDIPSTKELFAEAVVLFDPSTEAAMATALKEVTSKKHTELKKAGKRLATKYNWEDTSQKTAEVYEKLTRRS